MLSSQQTGTVKHWASSSMWAGQLGHLGPGPEDHDWEWTTFQPVGSHAVLERWPDQGGLHCRLIPWEFNFKFFPFSDTVAQALQIVHFPRTPGLSAL